MTDRKDIRSQIITTLFLVGLGMLMIQTFRLQVMDRGMKTRADSHAVQRDIIYPSRGLIYDRTGDLLVINKPVYDIQVTASQLDPEMDKALLASLLNISLDDLESQLDKNWKSGRYSKHVPYTLIKNIGAEQFQKFHEHLYAFPGISYKLRHIRKYPHVASAHMLGYISEVDAEFLESHPDYSTGDYHGTTGIERYYEDILRGHKGVDYILRDNIGRAMGEYESGRYDINPESGSDLYLSIDQKLQEYGERLLGSRPGSIVAIEPGTGEILAMVSTPGYDLNDMSIDADRAATYRRLTQDSLRPFFNRAISARYPPGSIFKPILSLIALQEGILQSDRLISCTGAYHYRLQSWGCHAGPGIRSVRGAIEQSCNTFFYQTYRELVEQYGWNRPGYGLNKLQEYLSAFGLGTGLGVDIQGESDGLNPGGAYYDNLYRDEDGEWRSTYIISNGIGQGEMELTTLQMANTAAAIANRGYYIQPHLLRHIQNAERREYPSYKRQHIPIDAEHYEPVIDGMRRAISGGTAALARIPGIPVAGKTGTSQNPHGEDHSVFFAFAPVENPQIAIAVYVEHAGWGARYAAPIASLMIEQHLRDSIGPSREWIERLLIPEQPPLPPADQSAAVRVNE